MLCGHLIGIVTAKLNAALIARFTGDIPQNVNFALKAEVARTFLDSKGIGIPNGPFAAAAVPCRRWGSRGRSPCRSNAILMGNLTKARLVIRLYQRVHNAPCCMKRIRTIHTVSGLGVPPFGERRLYRTVPDAPQNLRRVRILEFPSAA